MNPQTRVYYELSRLNALEDWWHFAILIVVVGAITGYVYWMYRRDWIELPRPLGWSLLLLRVLAFSGLLLFFLDLQKRSEQPVVKPSKLAVLVDNSLSMTLPAGDIVNESSQLDSGTVSLDPGFPQESRIQQVQRAFADSELLLDLAKRHEVSVYQLTAEQRLAPLANFAKTGKIDDSAATGPINEDWNWRTISWIVWTGTVLFLVGLLMMTSAIIKRLRSPVSGLRRQRIHSKSLFDEHNPDWIAYVALGGVVASILSVILIGTAAVRTPEYPFFSLWSWTKPTAQVDEANEAELNGRRVPETEVAIDWQTKLTSQGIETRVGDAIASILVREQNSPLAGIVVFTDGQNNAGLSLESAGGQAAAAGVPIYVVGLGSALDPINARLVDMNAPRRVFPGDPVRIAATIQASGMNGKSITVQLRRRSGSTSETGSSTSFSIEQEAVVQLPEDGQMTPVNFDVSPPSIGAYSYDVRLLTSNQDSNKEDDSAAADVEVVEPKATVLIFAGGPTREYQFVRNLLFRDETIQSHVYLQTGGPGISQEADELLTEFPSTAEEMSKYDCVLTFDADIMKLDLPAIEVLEEWVSSGAGGLVIVAGAVSTPEWAGSAGNTDPRAALMRDMSPVVVNARGSRLVSLGRFESETVWPLNVTAESGGVDFLDIANAPSASAEAWKSFSGVYSFYATYDPKPGATSLMLFSDPSTSVDGKLPIYLASQFYGGGRVVFQGSGEMWRIREVDENYFNTYWTKLVRWTAQGRLLRDSDYGLLLVDKEEALLGEQISVRAVLKDQQFRPLTLPNVTASLVDPSGKLNTLTLESLPGTGQAGVYVGQFLLRQAGKFQVRLDTKIGADSVLVRQVNARVPTLEIERPKRNDEALLTIANRTEGTYYAGVSNALNGRPFPHQAAAANDSSNVADAPASDIPATSIVDQILPRDQVTFLPGAPDRAFQERWMLVLMIVIAGALSVEWLLRRLSRLA